MLDYRINTFLKVCETLNYTLAAKELHITQPAVSQHIHYLEEEYETTLFVYSNKQLFEYPQSTGNDLREV
ncbi:MAG: LysR family transcriptional regulator [Catenibacterium mitsuokai]|nr:LysR family transcriptional regulator [Catenibacterium mitsuokai]MEE0081048.1 LysR family transcriptional regulator [Catenibacterium mitsuokai]